MKKLILYDHLGNKLLEQDIFVEGKDFSTKIFPPKAFWLGNIYLVDKEPEITPIIEKIFPPVVAESKEEVMPSADESEEVYPEDTGERGVSEASKPESVERISEESAGEGTD